MTKTEQINRELHEQHRHNVETEDLAKAKLVADTVTSILGIGANMLTSKLFNKAITAAATQDLKRALKVADIKADWRNAIIAELRRRK